MNYLAVIAKMVKKTLCYTLFSIFYTIELSKSMAFLHVQYILYKLEHVCLFLKHFVKACIVYCFLYSNTYSHLHHCDCFPLLLV